MVSSCLMGKWIDTSLIVQNLNLTELQAFGDISTIFKLLILQVRRIKVIVNGGSDPNCLGPSPKL